MSLALFIVNPIAGKRKKGRVINEIKNFCNNNNIDYEFFFTTGNRDDSKNFIKNFYRKDWLSVVAVGGGGTINEGAEAIVNRDRPLLLIPSGSGYATARHLNMLASTTD